MDLAFRGRYGLEIVDTRNLLQDQEARARQLLVSLDEKGRQAGRTRDPRQFEESVGRRYGGTRGTGASSSLCRDVQKSESKEPASLLAQRRKGESSGLVGATALMCKSKWGGMVLKSSLKVPGYGTSTKPTLPSQGRPESTIIFIGPDNSSSAAPCNAPTETRSPPSGARLPARVSTMPDRTTDGAAQDLLLSKESKKKEFEKEMHRLHAAALQDPLKVRIERITAPEYVYLYVWL